VSTRSSPGGNAATESTSLLSRFTGVFRYSRKAIELVWETSPALTICLGILTVIAGVLPAAIAYVGQLIVDAVVDQIGNTSQSVRPILWLLLLEAGIVIGLSGAQRGISVCNSLLRSLLGQRVNMLILEKAQSLELAQFEDSEFYDKLLRARREASSKPLSLVTRTFSLIQNAISLISFAFLLAQFSPLAVFILVLAGLPSFFAETKFSNDAFSLFRWRSPQARRQLYLETVLTREDSIKEVKLFGLAPILLQRYREIFSRLFKENKSLTIRRDSWGFLLGLLSTAAFYGAYAWIVIATIRVEISLGEMTMYLLLFRQGQAAVAASLASISGMYEDNLYLSTLYEYLEQPTNAQVEDGVATGARPGDGLRFDRVSFRYPGSEQDALSGVTVHLKPGSSIALVGENGSGKTTLIKLLTRLYRPSSGQIWLDGTELSQWSSAALQRRIGVIFQDFGRYQFTVGENIGAGDPRYFDDEKRWRQAASDGLAEEFISKLDRDYHTQLGRWFEGGRELSGGQWQKIALARAFMRSEADILVLDEPTAAMDASAEAAVFEHFQRASGDKMTILISHRFSTVRAAHQILVLDQGTVVEHGNHAQLLELEGRYAKLFHLQAKGYQ